MSGEDNRIHAGAGVVSALGQAYEHGYFDACEKFWNEFERLKKHHYLKKGEKEIFDNMHAWIDKQWEVTFFIPKHRREWFYMTREDLRKFKEIGAEEELCEEVEA